MVTETKTLQNYIDEYIQTQEGKAVVILHVRPDGTLTDDMDDTTGHGIRVDHVHHEVHEGDRYTMCNSQTEGNGGKVNIAFKTPNTSAEIHLIYKVRASGEAHLKFHEAPTMLEDTGSQLLVRNRKRASTNTSTITSISSTPSVNEATVDATLSVNGTILEETHFGAGQNSDTQERGEEEWVLKSNTIYALEVESEAASNDLSLRLDFYEHTPLA